LTPPPRIPLPLLTAHSNRAAVTCEYKCGDACSHEPPNPSANTYLGDIVTDVISRRGALKAGAVVAFAAGGVVGLSGSAAAGESRTPGLNFEKVQPNTLDAVVVPKGYEQAVVIRWGDPVLPGAPPFNFKEQSAKAQALQFGYNNDFAALMPCGDNQLLVTNHEYTSESFMFHGYDATKPTEEQVKIGWAAHGLSVVEVESVRRSGALKPVIGPRNRRITMLTPFKMTGPAAGSDLLKTSVDPTGTVALGTLNNCAGGVTPWGTILSGEENFNQYWANAGLVTDETVKARAARYGVSTGETGRKWERFDKRFDMLKEPNEVNRFGYVIELDPYDPDSTPVKHTALGRFKHECANIRVARDGRVVAYSGDDERFEYLYKFVSKNKMRKGHSRTARRYNMTLLDEGTLYVAKFTGDSPASEIDGTGKLPSDGEFDGTGEWIPLASGKRSFVPGMTAEEVYVFTRQAADKVAATKMDRPEDVEASPKTGKVYIALSNNVERGVRPGREGATEMNPRNNNKHGHVMELTERDPLSLRFNWLLFLVCGDPNSPDTYFAGFPKDQVSPISSPDNVAFDPYGNLWISTDSAGALGINDGLYGVAVDGPQRGNLKLFLTVPKGAETCGPIVRERVITICVQHPGEVDNASADKPVSHWPDGGDSQPRPSVVAVWKPGRRGPDRIGG
jgi:secreted PhoX family phosphatase